MNGQTQPPPQPPPPQQQPAPGPENQGQAGPYASLHPTATQASMPDFFTQAFGAYPGGMRRGLPPPGPAFWPPAAAAPLRPALPPALLPPSQHHVSQPVTHTEGAGPAVPVATGDRQHGQATALASQGLNHNNVMVGREAGTGLTHGVAGGPGRRGLVARRTATLREAGGEAFVGEQGQSIPAMLPGSQQLAGMGGGGLHAGSQLLFHSQLAPGSQTQSQLDRTFLELAAGAPGGAGRSQAAASALPPPLLSQGQGPGQGRARCGASQGAGTQGEGPVPRPPAAGAFQAPAPCPSHGGRGGSQRPTGVGTAAAGAGGQPASQAGLRTAAGAAAAAAACGGGSGGDGRQHVASGESERTESGQQRRGARGKGQGGSGGGGGHSGGDADSTRQGGGCSGTRRRVLGSRANTATDAGAGAEQGSADAGSGGGGDGGGGGGGSLLPCCVAPARVTAFLWSVLRHVAPAALLGDARNRQ